MGFVAAAGGLLLLNIVCFVLMMLQTRHGMYRLLPDVKLVGKYALGWYVLAIFGAFVSVYTAGTIMTQVPGLLEGFTRRLLAGGLSLHDDVIRMLTSFLTYGFWLWLSGSVGAMLYGFRCFGRNVRLGMPFMGLNIVFMTGNTFLLAHTIGMAMFGGRIT